MKSVVGIITLLIIIVTACSKPQEVSFDPYYPNDGVKVKDLKRAGYQLVSADDGICLFEKEKNGLYFYGDMGKDCKTVNAQELYIYPKGKRNYYDFDESKGRNVTSQDSIDFLMKLENFGTTAIFDIQNVNECTAKFFGKNKAGKIIEWRATKICSDGITLSTYAKIN